MLHPGGFPWPSAKNQKIVSEANLFVDNCIEACEICHAHDDRFLFERPEDLGQVHGDHPGSVWQRPEMHQLISTPGCTSFAVQQCQFGADTPKPTRFATDLVPDERRCFHSMPWFDKFGSYQGPLPREGDLAKCFISC